MARVYNTAMLYKMAMLETSPMPPSLSHRRHDGPAKQHVADVLRSHHWSVEVLPEASACADLIIQRGEHRFIVEVKALSEGRPDRVLPMLSMAILQARAAAEQSGDAAPLAIVFVPQASPSLTRQVELFAQTFAKDVPVGIISRRGEQYFSNEALQPLNRGPRESGRLAATRAPKAINLFSDLNQWMLKLLLACELPDGLLNAPRRSFKSGSDLAEAAQVSAMSASRFLQQLRSEGFLSDTSAHLKLVRREELFRRWGAAAMRPCPEMPCRFLLRIPAAAQMRDLLERHPDDACLGLFAAADALDIGHVSGVPPHVHVQKLPQVGASDWSGLMAHPTDRPDLILRQAAFPQSTFRGAVRRDGLLVADILQVWLDVMNHPARGSEQAGLIYSKYLLPLVSS